MGSVLSEIDDDLREWVEAQPMWFVGTAPSAVDGHVNVSPKGGRGLFRVVAPMRVAYLDLFGSGIETVAHLRENGRIVIMFAAFEGRPRIVRFHGRGAFARPGDDRWDELVGRFELSTEQRLAARTVVEVDVHRVSTSCGFVVPEMDLVGERQQLFRYAASRLATDGPDAIADYIDVNNTSSIDGLPGLDARNGAVDDKTRRRHDATGRVL